MIKLLYLLITAAFAGGMYLLVGVILFRDRYLIGRKAIRNSVSQDKAKTDIWAMPIIRNITSLGARIVYLDDAARDALEKQLARVDLLISPEQYTARKYVIILGGVIAVLICIAFKFWFGLIIAVLIMIYSLLRQHSALTDKIKVKDAAVAEELPRFVRTLCQQLQTNRDIPAALKSYRKIAGTELGHELDIMLLNIKTGSIPSALQLFQQRLGTDAIYRLCGALTDIERGIDQTATLNYLADDMARTAKLNLQRKMATLPGKMRLTYIPAVLVCAAIIFYVLAVFTVNSLNTLF